MLDYIGSIEYAADQPFLYPGDAVKKYLFQLFMDLISLLEETIIGQNSFIERPGILGESQGGKLVEELTEID